MYRGGRLDVIRKEACSSYRTIFGVRLCWELEEPKGSKGLRRLINMPFPSLFSFFINLPTS